MTATPNANFQFYLSDAAFLFGDGVLGEVQGSWPVGFLATPAIRSRDLDRPAGDPGSTLGVNDPGPRMLEIPLWIKSKRTTDAERMADVRQLVQPFLDHWAPSRSVTEWRLDTRLPGTPKTIMSYFGEPRELNEPQLLETLGILAIDPHFECSDPWAYGPTDTTTSNDGQAELTQSGNVNSKRCTIVATAGGPTGTITNLDDPDGLTMTFAGIEDATLTIDLAGWNVTGTGGANRDGLLRNDSGWPELVPGSNRLAFTGFTQLAVTWRPAYR